MNKQIVRAIPYTALALTILVGALQFKDFAKRHDTNGMEATIYSLVDETAKNACYPDGSYHQNMGENASIIYKRKAHRSCIDEDKVNIPYYDERLAKAEVGEEYLVIDHSK